MIKRESTIAVLSAGGFLMVLAGCIVPAPVPVPVPASEVYVDDYGYRHEGYYDHDRHWHGGYYDEHHVHHDDAVDWHGHR
jgi:hypothetical protein